MVFGSPRWMPGIPGIRSGTTVFAERGGAGIPDQLLVGKQVAGQLGPGPSAPPSTPPRALHEASTFYPLILIRFRPKPFH